MESCPSPVDDVPPLLVCSLLVDPRKVNIFLATTMDIGSLSVRTRHRTIEPKLHPITRQRHRRMRISIVSLLLVASTAVEAFVSSSSRPTPSFVVPANQRSLAQGHVASTENKRQCRPLFMGWGPDPVWSSAEVKTNEAANPSAKSVSLKVSVPPETAGEYKIPGQYVQFRLNEDTKPLFLAISSAPDAENAEFEFLIKKTPDNKWITDSAPGTKVEISQVLGGGFPMEENLEGFKYDFPTQNILLFGVGSGIAPIKAAMESGKSSQSRCCLFEASVALTL